MTGDPFARLDEGVAFRHTLDHETDRGCALMAASYVDSQLDELLRKRFVKDLDVADNLLGQAMPLASFSARIDSAYALGLIGPRVRRDIHLIRKIRNEFGHNPTLIDFGHAPIEARCREMYHDGYEYETARKRF